MSQPLACRPTLAGVLRISQAYVDAIVAHARRDFPDEACGIIAGPEGSDRAERLVPMTNADRSPTFFRFDPAEQLALYKEMDSNDEEIVVVYHSHTSTEAYPSRTDISYAAEPQAHYLLASVAETVLRTGRQRCGRPHRGRGGHRGGDRDHRRRSGRVGITTAAAAVVPPVTRR